MLRWQIGLICALAATPQKAVRADGSRLHGVGIRPSAEVRRTLKGLAEGKDDALEKAIELVRPPAK